VPLALKSDLVELERRFWRSAGDATAYAEWLAPDAVHVFPGWGVVDRTAALEGVDGAGPWEAFRIDDPRVVQLGVDTAALVYVAEARRPSEGTYRAAIASVYRRTSGGWQLVLHQQTPLSTS
jgi:hypothetical protein